MNLNTSTAALKDNHIPQLDGLRFFAIVMVMVAHWLQWRLYNPFLINFPFTEGVTLFFVLSGFLITKILLSYKTEAAEKKNSFLLKNFYIRRFLRIFPIYYGLLFFLYAIDYENTRELSPWLFSYTVNIYQSIENVYIGCYNHFWSLSVEEQFYIFWPLLIVFVKPKHVFKVIVLTIVLSLIIKCVLFFTVDKWMAVAYSPFCSMNSLGLGALLAYLDLFKPDFFRKITKPLIAYSSIFILASVMLCIHLAHAEEIKIIVENFLFALLSAFIIARASVNGFQFLPKFILENKFIVYSGKISYGLYVYHMFAPQLYWYFGPKIGLSVTNRFTEFILCYFITFGVAHLSWIIVERPINALKSRFPYVRKVES